MPGTQIQTGALTSLARAKRHLGIPPYSHEDDPFLIDVINAASQWTKDYLKQPVIQTSFAFNPDNEGLLWGSGSNTLKLPFRPILEITRLDPDVRSGDSWVWNGTDEDDGNMTYGADNDWVINMRTGEITLVGGGTWGTVGWTTTGEANGPIFPSAPVVRVEGRAGYADGSYTADTDFVFGGDIFTSANNGGKFHYLFGWERAGESMQNAVDQLVAHIFRYKDRAKDNVQSRSGEGITITFFENIPREITEALSNALPLDPVT
jgi:hypothetical protein